MKKTFFILSVLFTSVVGNAQNRTNYYRYNSSNGTSERIGYSENERTSKYNDYVGLSESTLDAYTQAGVKKQQQYEARIEIIQEHISDINRLLKKVNNYSYEDAVAFQQVFLRLISNLNKSPNGVADYNTYVFYNAKLIDLNNEMVDYVNSK